MFDNIPSQKTQQLIALLLVLLALVLRIHHLDFESLFMDELLQISYYGHSLTNIVDLASRQQQPPLDYWIGHFVQKFWDSDFTVRLPAALFGVATVFILFRMLSRMVHPYIAASVCVVIALLPFHLYFSQYARPYAIAIFFFAAQLLILQVIFMENRISWKTGALLLFVSFCLLMSRTLSPLVSTVSVLSVFLGFIGWSFTRWGSIFKKHRMCLSLCLLLMSSALMLYLPFLQIVLDTGSRYANTDLDPLSTILAGIENFSLRPLWEALITQFEPISYLLVMLLLAAYGFLLGSKKARDDIFLVLVSVLLPLVSLLNIFIFQAKTTISFRPPYAIYLIPLCSVLLAFALHAIYKSLSHRNIRLANLSMLLTIMVLWVPTGKAMLDFKEIRKATDWRSLGQYLQSNHERDHLFVFGSLNPGIWEPTFYGFFRYFDGKHQGTNFASMQEQLPLMVRASFKPIIILFRYRDYFLTNNSKYSFHPAPGKVFDLPTDALKRNPDLSLEEFTGFYVISSTRRTKDSAEDLRFLIEQILAGFPEDSAFAEIHLALAALNKALGNEWQHHVDIALRTAPAQYQQTAASKAAQIRAATREELIQLK